MLVLTTNNLTKKQRNSYQIYPQYMLPQGLGRKTKVPIEFEKIVHEKFVIHFSAAKILASIHPVRSPLNYRRGDRQRQPITSLRSATILRCANDRRSNDRTNVKNHHQNFSFLALKYWISDRKKKHLHKTHGIYIIHLSDLLTSYNHQLHSPFFKELLMLQNFGIRRTNFTHHQSINIAKIHSQRAKINIRIASKSYQNTSLRPKSWKNYPVHALSVQKARPICPSRDSCFPNFQTKFSTQPRHTRLPKWRPTTPKNLMRDHKTFHPIGVPKLRF